MIEVFVAFSKMSSMRDLEMTLESWDQPGMEPVAIQVKPGKFELHRRVTAENIARGNYILAKMGSGPVEENFGELAEQFLRDHEDAGVVMLEPGSEVMICRRGVITHWPQPRTVSYACEHGEAYEFVGYKAYRCATLHYRQLAASLPS